MNKSYDVYMCRNLHSETADLIEHLINSERYGDATKFLKMASSMDNKWKSAFVQYINNKPKSSTLKRKIILESIANYLNGRYKS